MVLVSQLRPRYLSQSFPRLRLLAGIDASGSRAEAGLGFALAPLFAEHLPHSGQPALIGFGLKVGNLALRSWSQSDLWVLAAIISIPTLTTIIFFLLLDRKRRKWAQSALATRFALESAVSALSVRLSGSPPEQLDAEIAGGLERIRATKASDHVAWSVFSEDGTELQETHFAHRRGIPHWSALLAEKELPWCIHHLLRGEAVMIANPEHLPPEADVDQRYLKQRGVQSLALVPTSSDKEVKGVLTLVYHSASREWPSELVSQLQLVGSILANTLSGKQAQEARRNSEERFRHLFEAASIGMALENAQGQLLFVNPALCSIMGYTREELRTMRCSQFSDPEDEQQDWALFQQLTAGLISAYQIEKRYVRKDKARIWGRLHVSLLRSNPSEPPLVIAMVEDITKRKMAEEDLRNAKTELQWLAGKLIHAQEEEKQRIARELHDDFGQRLSLLAVELDLMIQEQPIVNPPNRGRLSSVLEQLDELATDVHGLSHRLHSSKLQHLGLTPALGELCRQLSGKGFKVQLDVDDVEEPVPPEIAMCLYRVAQEALNNSMKHSGVSQAFVQLTGNNGSLHMVVKDDGVGFDVKTASGGLGLASMRERLRALDGSLMVRSHAGAGTELIVEVPVPGRVPQAKAS